MADEPRALAPVERAELSDPMADAAASVKAVRTQMIAIQSLMREVMAPDEDYGIVPGCKKPSLYKPGAEKLCLMFRLRPELQITEERDGEHLTVRARVTLYSIINGGEVGAAEGMCSTKETKYAFRHAGKVCPKCGAEAIIKGKVEYGGGWVCYQKKDGCGAKWPDGAAEIENQKDAKIPNENLADQYNTVLQMAIKRGFVAVTRTATAAGAIFGDLEQRPQQSEVPAKPEIRRPEAKSGQPNSAAVQDAPKSATGTTWTGKLANVETKKGTTKQKDGSDKPYTLYTILGADGWKCATFSDTDADLARSIIARGDDAEIAYEEGKYGPKLKSIQPIAIEAPDEPGAGG